MATYNGVDKRIKGAYNSGGGGDISALTARVTALETTTADHETRITAAETNITSQGTRLTTAETNITALQGESADYETRISALETTVGTANSVLEQLLTTGV